MALADGRYLDREKAARDLHYALPITMDGWERNQTKFFRNSTKAGWARFCHCQGMYLNDGLSGKTIFILPAMIGAQKVTLEGFGNSISLRVPMRREANGWSAKVKLAAGWFFYRFVVDGKSKWDPEAGKCRVQDGQTCSLALIHGVPRQKKQEKI